MSKKTWRITLLCLLILALLLSLSGCQLVEGAKNTAHEFSHAPDRLVNVFTNLMDSIKGVGTALAESISNMVRGMTGR